MLYFIGIVVLLLLGMISGSAPTVHGYRTGQPPV
jgi:hypothetical protein